MKKKFKTSAGSIESESYKLIFWSSVLAEVTMIDKSNGNKIFIGSFILRKDKLVFSPCIEIPTTGLAFLFMLAVRLEEFYIESC